MPLLRNYIGSRTISTVASRTIHSVPRTARSGLTILLSLSSTIISLPTTTRRSTSTRRKKRTTLSIFNEWIEQDRRPLCGYAHFRSPFNSLWPVWVNYHSTSRRINLLDKVWTPNLVPVCHSGNCWEWDSNDFRPRTARLGFARSFSAKARATCRPTTKSPSPRTISRRIRTRARIGIIRTRAVRGTHHIGSRTAWKIQCSVATWFVHISRTPPTTVTARTIPRTSRIICATTRSWSTSWFVAIEGRTIRGWFHIPSTTHIWLASSLVYKSRTGLGVVRPRTPTVWITSWLITEPATTGSFPGTTRLSFTASLVAVIVRTIVCRPRTPSRCVWSASPRIPIAWTSRRRGSNTRRWIAGVTKIDKIKFSQSIVCRDISPFPTKRTIVCESAVTNRSKPSGHFPAECPHTSWIYSRGIYLGDKTCPCDRSTKLEHHSAWTCHSGGDWPVRIAGDSRFDCASEFESNMTIRTSWIVKCEVVDRAWLWIAGCLGYDRNPVECPAPCRDQVSRSVDREEVRECSPVDWRLNLPDTSDRSCPRDGQQIVSNLYDMRSGSGVGLPGCPDTRERRRNLHRHGVCCGSGILDNPTVCRSGDEIITTNRLPRCPNIGIGKNDIVGNDGRISNHNLFG